jgi:hypothetical protein
MASELIIQLQQQDRTFSCEKFDNLPSPKSAYVAICFNDTPQAERYANDLKDKLIHSISNIGNNFLKSRPPCGGLAMTFGGCQALGIIDNLKLLVVVSDGISNTFAEPNVLNWLNTTLPVLKLGNPYNLSPPFNIPNAAFWSNDIDEVIPTIFGKIGISEEDQKVFISYKRTDTSVFAEQLFDRLNHEGFEVFLDRFSINPGINFQNRLYQELADKAMVLFIESPSYQSSHWVQYEIDFAKKYRLGLLAINTKSSPKVKTIDDEFRRTISLDKNGILDNNSLDNLVADIRLQHSIALYRLRYDLTTNILAALQNKGASPKLDANGFIAVKNPRGIEYKIWGAARPPKVNDYHYSDISNPAGEKVIVGPEFMEQIRDILNSWLSNKASVHFYNEGQLLELTNLIFR